MAEKIDLYKEAQLAIKTGQHKKAGLLLLKELRCIISRGRDLRTVLKNDGTDKLEDILTVSKYTAATQQVYVLLKEASKHRDLKDKIKYYTRSVELYRAMGIEPASDLFSSYSFKNPFTDSKYEYQ